MVGRKVGIIASAAYVGEEIQVEVGALPPAFLPFRGQRLYRHQVHFLRRRADHILLTVPKSFQMSVVDEEWLAENRVSVVKNPENLSLGKSISQAIPSSPPDFELHLLHGDTFLPDLEPTRPDSVVVSDDPGRYEWGLFEGKAIAGYFSFSSGALFLSALGSERGNFLRALSHYSRKRELSAATTQTWLDFGHLQNLYEARRYEPHTRFFNHIQFDGAVVTKQSTATEASGLLKQARWFEELPRPLARFTPAYLGRTVQRHAKRNGKAEGYQLSHEANPSLHDLFVFFQFRDAVWERVVCAIFDYLRIARALSLREPGCLDSDEAMRFLVEQKTRSRLRDWALASNLDLDVPWVVNGVEMPSLNTILAECAQVALEGPGLAGVMHGDLCFTNMFFDFRTEAIKLIDPRGSSGPDHVGVMGDIRYDLAKLLHSIAGYDHILAGNFALARSSDYEITFSLTDNQHAQQVEKIFSALQIEAVTIRSAAIQATTVTLFLSMLPLHADRPDRQLAFLANALRLYDLWFRDL